MVKLTEELRQAVDKNNGLVQIRDERTNNVYYLVPAAEYQKLKALVEAEDIDPSFFEFEDEDFDPRATNHS